MKKLLAAFVVVMVLGYLAIAGLAWYHDKTYADHAAAQTAASVEAALIRGVFDRNACYYCHTTRPALPGYAALPGIRQLSERDTGNGLRYFRMDAVYAALADGTPAPEAALAKLEAVARDGSMPPALFRSVHWSADFGDADRKALLDWIGAQRKEHYQTPGVSPAHAGDPVQPLPAPQPVDPRKVALGTRLFHDPRLSADNSMSCATCHSLSTGGVDGNKFSPGVGGTIGVINAPTVFNATLNHMQFWDGRAQTLQDQAGGPPLNPVEMASVSWDQIVGKLQQDQAFTGAFRKVYPDGWSEANITNAIAEFEKTLLTPSRFDAYLRGDEHALTREEIRGYELFNANRCATCHVGKNLGGQSFERMGRAADYFAERGDARTDADNGRWSVTQDPHDRYAFKTPGLRNVELTAPYFHDGSRTDLRAAVRDMAKYQVGKTLPEADVDAIVAFLNSLTGVWKPVAAP